MAPFVKLDFPPVRLRARRQGAQTQVWDDLRGMWLVLTPEEWVRRHAIAFFETGCGAARRRIVQEFPVPMNGAPQRADLVVMDRAAQPLLLCECKAPSVAVTESVWAQVIRYNSVVRARYVVLTNGLKHYCYEATDTGYRKLAAFPDLSGR